MSATRAAPTQGLEWQSISPQLHHLHLLSPVASQLFFGCGGATLLGSATPRVRRFRSVMLKSPGIIHPPGHAHLVLHHVHLGQHLVFRPAR
jgi:hypothetical protein